MLDQLGIAIQGELAHPEKLMQPINRLTFQGMKPSYGNKNFVAPNAAVIGDVTLGPRTSVWYGATLRGDVNSIKIGSQCNIQDKVVIHVAKNNPAGQALSTTIGDNVCPSCDSTLS
jgi:carbonic anhydrase/acetyltransferase-like protein (isoleucine patch superfamily)